MSFIRHSTVNGHTYYAVVQSYRDGGKVRHRQLAYLGRYPTVPAAIDGFGAELEAAEGVVKQMWGRAGEMMSLARHAAHRGSLPRPDANHDPTPFRRWCRTYWESLDRADKATKRAHRLRERLAELREVATSVRTEVEAEEVQA